MSRCRGAQDQAEHASSQRLRQTKAALHDQKEGLAKNAVSGAAAPVRGRRRWFGGRNTWTVKAGLICRCPSSCANDRFFATQEAFW